MLGLSPRQRSHRVPPAPRRFRPSLERLEARDCPAAPVLSNFTATPVAGTQVTLSGQMTESGSGPVTLTFSGVITGTVTLNGSGPFTVSKNATALGQVSAVAQDSQGENSATAQAQVSCPPPSITGFTAANNYGNVWTFSGTVSDLENPAGLVVQLGGLTGLTATATCNSNGQFTVTVTLPYGTTGTATANTTDWWGQSATTADYYCS